MLAKAFSRISTERDGYFASLGLCWWVLKHCLAKDSAQPSNEIRDGAEFGIKEPTVGTEGKPVRHIRDPVTDQPRSHFRIWRDGDLAFDVFRDEAQACGLCRLDVAIMQHFKEPLENEIRLMIELLELRATEDEFEGDFFVQIRS